jgi:hypothetical protein
LVETLTFVREFLILVGRLLTPTNLVTAELVPDCMTFMRAEPETVGRGDSCMSAGSPSHRAAALDLVAARGRATAKAL